MDCPACTIQSLPGADLLLAAAMGAVTVLAAVAAVALAGALRDRRRGP